MINTSKTKIREFEITKSNISDYLDKNLEIVDCRITEGEGDFPLCDIILDNGDIVKTTSKVLTRQMLRQKEQGLPVKCQIKKFKGKYPYYCLVAPE